MDVTLLAASAGLAVFLPSAVPQHIHARMRDMSSSGTARGITNNNSDGTPRILTRSYIYCSALLLSLSLFSLSIMEAMPKSWLILVDNGVPSSDTGITTREGYVTLISAYRVVLWLQCLLTAVVIPALAGLSYFLSSSDRVDTREKSYEGAVPSATARHNAGRGASSSFGRSGNFFLSIIFFLPKLGWTILRLLIVQCFNKIKGRKGGRSESQQQRKRVSYLRIRMPAYIQFGSIAGCLVGVILSFVIFELFGALAVHVAEEPGNVHLLQVAVSRLCAVGVFISSIFNGFGSVSMPYTCLAGLFLEPISPEAISKAEKDYSCIQGALEAKCRSLAETQAKDENKATKIIYTTTASNYQNFADSFRNFCRLRRNNRNNSSGDDTDHVIQGLVNEIEFLQTLSEEVRDEIEEMKWIQKSAANARTPIGRIQGWIGIIFSIVLLIRMFTAILSVVDRPGNTMGATKPSPSSPLRRDPITTAFLWLLGHKFVTDDQYQTFSQCISLFLTGFLSVSQVRTFLRMIGALNRRLSGIKWRLDGMHTSRYLNKNARDRENNRTQVYLYLVASMMGCYFLSCVVLTKMNLPIEYRLALSAAIGGMNFEFDSVFANMLFSASAMLSAVTLGFLFGIRRQHSIRHTFSAIDELGVSGPEIC